MTAANRIDGRRFRLIRDTLAESVQTVVDDHVSWGWDNADPADETTPARIRSTETPQQLLAICDAETDFGDSWGPDGVASEMIDELRVHCDES